MCWESINKKKEKKHRKVVIHHIIIEYEYGEKNHNFKWDKVDILDIEPSYNKRLISEYILRNRNME